MDGRVIDPAGTRPTALCVCACVYVLTKQGEHGVIFPL